MSTQLQQIKLLGGAVFFIATGVSALKNCVYSVDTGHKAFKFNKISGTRDKTFIEGLHLRIPFIERPIIFNVKSQPIEFKSLTGSKDLQEVTIKVRVLYRPNQDQLQEIWRKLGTNYQDVVLPSVVNEVLRSVVAQYNAATLLQSREIVSQKIKMGIMVRLRDFHIVLDDVSITALTFGKQFTDAIEQKQIAQQRAERARYVVQQAGEVKKATIIKAKGEAENAKAIGESLMQNTAYLDIKRLQVAMEIARIMGQTRNTIYLDSDSLLLNLTQGFDANLEKKQFGYPAATTPQKQ